MSIGPGATVIGVKTNDFVILAAEKRMTYGGYVITRHVKKVFKITDHVGIAAAGLVSDMQELFRLISYLIKLREIETGKISSVRSIAKLTSNIMYSRKLFPYYTQILIGGVTEQPELYSLDPLGSLIEDDYIVIGSGAEIAIGIIESNFKKDMSVEIAKELVVNALKTAIGRDALSGDGMDMLIITSKGIDEVSLVF